MIGNFSFFKVQVVTFEVILWEKQMIPTIKSDIIF